MIIQEDLYFDIAVGQFLDHHGVKGMKWGVRKSESSTVSGGSQTMTQVLDFAEKNPYVVATAAILVTRAALAPLQSGEYHSLAERGKKHLTQNQNQSDSYWKKNDKLSNPNMSTDQIMSKVVKQVNPHFGQFGTKMNCRRATFAYEMRRRGYDVKATRTTNARGQDTTGMYNVMTPGTKNFVNPNLGGEFRKVTEKLHPGHPSPFTDFTKKFSDTGLERINSDSIFSSIAKHPNGSRGELCVMWQLGGGHSVAWEMVKGKPVVFDCQSGKKFTSQEEFKKEFKFGIRESGLTRLDNVPLNDDFLLRWLKNA